MNRYKCDACGFETADARDLETLNCQRESDAGSFCMKTARRVRVENESGRMSDLPGHSREAPQHADRTGMRGGAGE